MTPTTVEDRVPEGIAELRDHRRETPSRTGSPTDRHARVSPWPDAVQFEDGSWRTHLAAVQSWLHFAE